MNDLYPEYPILIVDDEQQYLSNVNIMLSIAGFNNILPCQDSREVEQLLSEKSFSIVMLDLSMPYVSGDQILLIIERDYPDLTVLVVTASNRAEHAVECLKSGVYDYLVKPLDKERLIASVTRAVEFSRIKNEHSFMKDFLLSDRHEVSDLFPQNGNLRRSSKLLHKTRQEYKSLFHNISIPTFVIRADDYSLMYVNEALMRFIGISENADFEARKIILLDYLDPTDRTSIIEELKAGRKVENLEILGKKENGELFSIILTCELFSDEGYIEGNFVDVSAKKSLEEQFRHAQKMEAIGRLAGGVAHDFNNIMTTIGGFAELGLMESDLSDSVKESFEEIQKSSKRAVSLTRQLLMFSRKHVDQEERVSLKALIVDLEKMLQRLLGDDIVLRIETNAQQDAVQANPGQIEQVILNLVVNARDALPHGGLISIETSNREMSESDCKKHNSLTPGFYVVISVRDSGCGMDRDVMSKIFEPFFTTKDKSKGTGLGLSTVYGIVNQSGGCITVKSEIDKGTVFEVCLPQVE